MPIKNWYDDPNDKELFAYIPILEKLQFVDDVWDYLPRMHGFQNNIDIFKASQVLQELTPQEDQKKPKTERKKTLTLDTNLQI